MTDPTSISHISLQPGIILAATPLGNIQDASPRLVHALATAPLIAAEDTRRTRTLAHALGVTITGRIISHFDHNEEERVSELLDAARTQPVLVVTDAGMPLVSDPGFRIVDAAHTHNIPVTCLPGPSAVTTALAVSGLGVGAFCFDGFAPRKSGARAEWLTRLRTETRATCFFESPHRIATTLNDALRILGPQRRATVCRELTKVHEEIKRGTLRELAQWAASGVKGEIAVVIAGVDKKEKGEEDCDALIASALERIEAGERVKDVTKEIAALYNLSKNELYTAIIARKNVDRTMEE